MPRPINAQLIQRCKKVLSKVGIHRNSAPEESPTPLSTRWQQATPEVRVPRMRGRKFPLVSARAESSISATQTLKRRSINRTDSR